MASITSRPVTGLDRATTAPATPISTRPPLGKGPGRATGGRRGRLAVGQARGLALGPLQPLRGLWRFRDVFTRRDPTTWGATPASRISSDMRPRVRDGRMRATSRARSCAAIQAKIATSKSPMGPSVASQDSSCDFTATPAFFNCAYARGKVTVAKPARHGPWPDGRITPRNHHQPARDGPLRVVTGVDRAAIAPQPNSTVVP